MAFASTIEHLAVIGNLKMATGTYTSDSGSTGGDIETGLVSVKSIFLTPKASSTTDEVSVVNETLPLASGDVTIVTKANEVGVWVAFGF